MNSDNGRVKLSPWWNPLTLKPDQCWHCAVGPLSLYLQRRNEDWLLAWEEQEDTPEHHHTISEVIDSFPEQLSVNRYAFRQPPSSFRLKPHLMDRPLVVKAEQPVKVPPGENITFYIGTPVCVGIELQDPSVALLELATVRLSDTWFGPSTQVGELCYAARTQARSNRDQVPLRPHRAVTPVTIHNRSMELLGIEKLSIPVPVLSVYGQADGTLWTDPVSLEHTQHGQLARLIVGRRPAGTELLSEARIPVQQSSLVRAFTSIFTD